MKFKSLLGMVLYCLSLACARAEVLVIPPPERITAGQPVTFQVYFKNDNEETTTFNLPERISARLSSGANSSPLELKADPQTYQTSVTLAPKSVCKVLYIGSIPPAVTGQISMELERLPANRVLLVVAPPSNDGSSLTATPVQELPPGPVQPAPFALLSPYDPIYFIVGPRGGWNAKFQLSFKYRLIRPDGPLALRYPGVENFYFSYTQFSLWDLSSPSSPFRDTSYIPRLFFLEDNLWRSRSGETMLGLETGLGHQSNGQDDPQSRSMNIAYVKPILRLGNPNAYHWVISPMVWDFLGPTEGSDLPKYWGYFDLNVKYEKTDAWQLSTDVRVGSETNHRTLQMNLSYPMTRLGWGNFDGYVLLQYFNGYGESLLDYNDRRSSQLRLGLMITR